jgi:hypothetical protein
LPDNLVLLHLNQKTKALKMINFPYKIDQVKNEIARKKRAEKRQFVALGLVLFVMYVTVSTMGYNDCINLGVC